MSIYPELLLLGFFMTILGELIMATAVIIQRITTGYWLGI